MTKGSKWQKFRHSREMQTCLWASIREIWSDYCCQTSSETLQGTGQSSALITWSFIWSKYYQRWCFWLFQWRNHVWKLRHKRFEQNLTEFWYAADVTFRDVNETKNDKTQWKFSPTIRNRKPRFVVCSTSNDEDPTMSFYPDCESLIGRHTWLTMWTINAVGPYRQNYRS